MARVMITCPTTGSQAFTGIETDAESVNLIPPINTRLLCPNCGRTHVWSMLDAEVVPEPPDSIDALPPRTRRAAPIGDRLKEQRRDPAGS